MIKWIKKNKYEFLGLLFVLLLAAFLRLYRIDEYMAFLGDEGRDALVVKGVLIDHHLPFIGPPTSVGNIYLGPLYYYMMTMAMAIDWLNPVGAAIMVALIGTATVGLVWWLTRQIFGSVAGLVSALLYAISATTIIYGRSSWNPNPAPFFTLLAIISFVKAHQSKKYRYLLLTGALVAAAVQMHYLCLILLPIFGCLAVVEWWHNRNQLKNLVMGGLGGVVTFVAVFTPWILFELKHNFMNLKAMGAVFFGNQGSVNANPLLFVFKLIPIYFKSLVGRYMADSRPLAGLIGIVLLGMLVWLLWKKSKEAQAWYYLLLAIWFEILN